GMTDEVGRQRGGRENKAQGEAQHEPQDEREPKPEAQHVDEHELEDEFEPEHVEDKVEVEEEQPPSLPAKPRKRNARTTRGRNPPPVTCYGGGPTDLSLLSGFGKHVNATLWRGEK
ncbi:hypothetical protein L195_g035389, partial [Trifolium pratense]